MSVVIRMQRAGGRNYPFFRVVVADSRRARDGRFLEKVGWYNPLAQPAQMDLDQERIHYWMERGARPSDAVNALLKHQVKLSPEAAKSPVTPTRPEDLPAVQEAMSRKAETKKTKPNKAEQAEVSGEEGAPSEGPAQGSEEGPKESTEG